jgi:hypothetical protein
MSERSDPSGTTDQFRVFVQSPPEQPAQRSRAALLGGLAVVALLAVVAAVYLATR